MSSATRELASALLLPRTYDLGRNMHAWIGLVFALPIPLVLVVESLRASESHGHALRTLLESPAHMFALGLPLAAMALGGAVGTIRFRSERRLRGLKRALWRSRQETRRACARLGRLDETKRRLVAAVSHELRTPLTAIVGYSDMLQNGRLGRLSPAQERALSVLQRAVARERAAVENLIAYARLETASYRPERSVIDLSDPVRAAHESVVDLARRRRVLLGLVLPEDSVPVDADAAGLALVVANLLRNAIEMTPPGGSVVVRAEPSGARARVTVTDSGPGLSPDVAPRIFEPFFQALGGDTREKGGAGLGLTIVKGVLEAHGTSVAVDEPPGGGARFSFALPLVPRPEAVLIPGPERHAA